MGFAQLLDLFGLHAGGVAKQPLSKLRIVAMSIAPTLRNAEAEAWIASKASLLNLACLVMTLLRDVTARNIDPKLANAPFQNPPLQGEVAGVA